MTFDERLAALGVETRDILPSNERCNSLYEKFYAVVERICKEMGEECDLEMILSYLIIAIAKRDDIIDRMETRIVNLTGARDYLLTQLEDDCMVCANADPKNHRVCAKYDFIPDDCFEFEGVPEDWSADDA